jgi:uncharacterized membrane protein
VKFYLSTSPKLSNMTKKQYFNLYKQRKINEDTYGELIKTYKNYFTETKINKDDEKVIIHIE